MQNPIWKILAKGGASHTLSIQIKKGHVIAELDGEKVLENVFSGYKNEFSISVLSNMYFLELRNKPVGGYDYSLRNQDNTVLTAIDSKPTIAVAKEAELAGENSSLKRLFDEYTDLDLLDVQAHLKELVEPLESKKLLAEKDVKTKIQKRKFLEEYPDGTTIKGSKTVTCTRCGYTMLESYGEKKFEFCYKCGAKFSTTD